MSFSTTTNNNIDLSTTVAGVHLPTCLYNASGPRSGTAAALHKVALSQSGAVLTKSATLLAQTAGNPQPRTYHAADDTASFNSEGLPNNGIDYYIAKETYQEAMMAQQSEDPDPSNNTKLIDKPYIVSLSGKCLADNIEMIKRTVQAAAQSSNDIKIDSIELNLACPNIIGKPIIAYDVEQMDDILKEIGTTLQSLRQQYVKIPPLGVKLPPYLDFDQLQRASAVLNRHLDTVRYVVAINTMGNALTVDGAVSEMPRIRSNDGYAGLSGPACKYTALANVRKLRQLLDPSIDIVGCGGVTTGLDCFELLLVGATAVQTATQHWKEGPACFDRILSELTEIMQEKGYTGIADFQNKLRPWSAEGAAKARLAAKTSNTNNSKASAAMLTNKSDTVSELQFYKLLCMVLTVVVAVLAANNVFAAPPPLLPSES